MQRHHAKLQGRPPPASVEPPPRDVSAQGEGKDRASSTPTTPSPTSSPFPEPTTPPPRPSPAISADHRGHATTGRLRSNRVGETNPLGPRKFFPHFAAAAAGVAPPPPLFLSEGEEEDRPFYPYPLPLFLFIQEPFHSLAFCKINPLSYYFSI